MFNRKNTTKYIQDVMGSIKTVLSSSESALLLNELYDKEFNLEDESAEDYYWGPVLYRDQEGIDDFNSYGNLVTIYLTHDINKFFNLSIDEFIDRPKYSREILILKSIEYAKMLTEKLQDIATDNKDKFNDLNNIEDDLNDIY